MENHEIIEELHGNIERASLKIFEEVKLKESMSSHEITKLANKFLQTGSAEPLYADEYYSIVGQEINLAAARKAGFRSMPVIKRKRPKNIKNFPNKILVELSNLCNLECIMCPAHGPTKDMKRKKMNMSFELFEKVIEEVNGYEKVDLLFHFYGEPLLNPDLARFFDSLAKKRNLGHLLMSTNGTLLDDNRRVAILNSPLHVLQISVNALQKDTYFHVTGGGDQDRVIRNVESFIEERNRRGQKLPFIRVQMVEMDCNEYEIEGFIRRWEGIADLIHANGFEKQGGRSMDQRKNKTYLPEERFFCDRLRRQDFVIYSNGDCTVCVYDYDGILALGNVKEKRISDMMQSPKYRELIRAHKEGDYGEFPLCASCTDWMF